VEYKSKAIPAITRATGTISKSLIITQQLTRKAQNPGTTNNSHIGQYTHALECTKVRVQNILNMQNSNYMQQKL
jgi:hypothetical protein